MQTFTRFTAIASVLGSTLAWIPATRTRAMTSVAMSDTDTDTTGALHGETSCFLPLKQLDQDYYAPRIIQVRTPVALRIVFMPYDLSKPRLHRLLARIQVSQEKNILLFIPRMPPRLANGHTILVTPRDRSLEPWQLKEAM